MSSNTIVLADTIHTLDDSMAAPKAINISEGRVVALGNRADAADWLNPSTEIVDLGDATIVPGLIDEHVHPVMGVALTTGPDLHDAANPAGLRDLLQAELRRLGHTDWLLAWGLEPKTLPPDLLHRRSLDAIAPGRATVVRFFDGHGMVVSSEALRRAGIEGPREFTDRSEIECDADGPTGVLQEMQAMDLINNVLPPPDPAALAGAVADRLRQMAAQGLTAVQAMEHVPGASGIYAGIESHLGGLPVRIRAFPWCTPGLGPAGWQQIADQMTEGGERWQVGGVKLFIDGTIDNGTAWLNQPDTHGQSTQSVWPDPEEYAAAIAFFDERGIPTATHAIGDHGVRFALEAIGRTGRVARHRIEHVESIPDDVIAQFAASGVSAGMQPTHCTQFTSSDGQDNWSQRLGQQRAAHAWRIKDLLRAGVPVAIGSDWPIAGHDPRRIMAAARHRMRTGDRSQSSLDAQQSISALAALTAYTRTAAWSVGEEDLGVIRVGSRAALTAFEVDPLRAEPQEFATAPVVLTMVDGDVVHRS
ncbi:amidohydrolase [Branchiibius sp. NY16-3462-2]|uniref:amidohydrolase n=1 Tax=Branchiibius sp. NY16-3462-2 TaxID=1807500 RepID=UPI00079BA29C|nr:amidohydrolase [Branchiibius sp. NY16-3462-2]KYH46183.1 hypothetical protein AZH51_11210 [Branchiibius sp. NY16-3462-2]